jgi:hypothetical protein
MTSELLQQDSRVHWVTSILGFVQYFSLILNLKPHVRLGVSQNTIYKGHVGGVLGHRRHIHSSLQRQAA